MLLAHATCVTKYFYEIYVRNRFFKIVFEMWEITVHFAPFDFQAAF